MKQFLKTFSRSPYWLAFFTILLLYFLLRLPSLTLQPVFCDEAIYIHWAQTILKDFKYEVFIPLTDGKTPLFMWLDAPFQKFFSDPLFGGRILSVFSGLLTVIGMVILGSEFFNKRVGLVSGFLVSVIPLTVFFDKMALTDSMLATFSIWSLIIALSLVQKNTLKKAVFLGILLAGGILTKTPGVFSFITLPFVLLTLNFKKERLEGLVKSAAYLIISLLVGYGIFNLLRFSSDFSKLSSRDQDYYFPVSRLFITPFNPFAGHIKDLADWLPKILTVPVVLLIAVSIIIIIYKRNLLTLTIFLWGLLPLLAMAFLLKTFTARYFIFSLIPMVFLAGYSIDYLYGLVKIKNKTILLIIALSLLSIPAFIFDYYLSTNPQQAPLPMEERRGYLEDWTAGYGLKEISQILNKESKTQKILVVTEGFFGTLPEGLQIYFRENPNITFWYSTPLLDPDVYVEAQTERTYFVVNKSHSVFNKNLKLIKEYLKAKGPTLPQDALVLYQVLP